MIIEPLDGEHNRLAFTCGNDNLDRYIHETAHQAKRKGLAAVWVATEPDDPATILGYYSLSSYVILGLDIPEAPRKKRKLPVREVAATLLGRLAVASQVQSKGIGAHLLSDALKRAYAVSSEVGSVCVVVDAIEERTINFYERFGFIRVDSQSLRLVIMMETIGKLVT